MRAVSLVLPRDFSQEELAASNIHLLKPTQHGPGAFLHRGAQQRFQQVDTLRHAHTHAPSHSFVPVLPNGSLLTVKAERMFNPATVRNLRSAFDQIMGRTKLAEMNLNGNFRGED